ncbi:MAG: hypothetical protein R3192_02305 [Woeseiaceae bacterium]|nr:hypothetical protein [Woeseiaceae bacterium]
MRTQTSLHETLLFTTVGVSIMLITPAFADEEFEEAEVFFELNNTDGDLGIHSAVDGGPWKELEMEGPNGRELLEIDVKSRLRRQGLTQLFYESAEPTFDELDPDKFFRRFPAGEYEIEGESLDGEEIESTTELTHTIPAQPQPYVNGIFHDTDCDDDSVVAVGTPVTISWPLVDSCHPTLGEPCDPGELEVHNYEVVVEAEIPVNGDELEVKTSTILPPSATSYTVPNDFIGLTDEWKFEILVREESFNQTAVESCFVIE